MVEVSVYVGISFGGVVDVGGVVAVAVGGVVLLLLAVAVIITIISMISLAIAMIVFSYPPPIVLRYRAPAIVVVDSQSESERERPPELNLGRLLDAIREIEGWRGIRGPAGEFGPFQILPSVWRHHSKVSPWRASANEHRRIALAQIAEIRRRLAAGERDANSAFMIALAWNAGTSAVIGGTAPARSWDYADRTRNIYDMNTMNNK